MKFTLNYNNRRYTVDGGSIAIPLTIVFVVLKLTEVIDWSWWWVLSPLWISALLGLLFLAIFVILAVVFGKKANLPGPVGRSLSRRR